MKAFTRIMAITVLALLMSAYASILIAQPSVLRPQNVLRQSEYDTLSWRTLAEPSLNFVSMFGGVGDTLAVWFKPLAPCNLIAIRFYPHDIKATCLLEVWDGAHYDGHIVSPDSVGEHGWIGEAYGGWTPGSILGHSPIGWAGDDSAHRLWGPFPFVVMPEHLGKWWDVPANLGLQKEVFLGDDPFIVSIVCYQVAGHGWGAEDEGTVPYHFFKYYHFPEDSPDGEHGGWFIQKESLWIEAVVKYVEATDVRGDVNQDGMINVVDVVQTVNIIMSLADPPGSEYELWAADCNNDENIDILDVVGIIHVILGIGQCQP